MSESTQRKYLTLTAACRVLRTTTGKRLHPSTLWRWCRKGIRGTRLRYFRVGRSVCVTEATLNEFFEALAKREGPIGSRGTFCLQSPHLPALDQAAILEAERSLDEAGL